MKIHYFQRYHSKENVATANTMLLLTRLYQYSSDKFYEFIKNTILSDRALNSDFRLSIDLQKKGQNSIPDAVIFQPSFRIVVETKIQGDFTLDQLTRHFGSFQSGERKILLTVDRNPIHKAFEDEVLSSIKSVDKGIIYKHITFEEFIEAIDSMIVEHAWEMKEVLNDFREFCSLSNLLPNDKYMMHVRLTGTTFAFNQANGLYYDDVSRGFSKHQYIGLYTRKAVRSIGKIYAIAVASVVDNELVVEPEEGKITQEMKDKIRLAIEDAKQYPYDLSVRTRYFFVEKFVDTLFEKTTHYAPMGTRVFNLLDLLEVSKLPAIEEIANGLRQKTW